MDTKLVDFDDEKAIEEAGEIIKNGGLVAFPTETVYGLGGDALNPESSKKIYAAKGRPSDNPLIVHIENFEDLYGIAKEIPESAKILADKFWPGPLTIIVNKNDRVPYETTGGLETVAVRLPSDETARKFIKAAGGYVAAPSANLSGRPSPTKAEHVLEDMKGRIEMVIDGGNSLIGLESTIVDLTEEVPMVLRPGFISLDMIKEIFPNAKLDPGLEAMSNINPQKAAEENANMEGLKSPDDKSVGLRPKAPGMRYRHYAPKAELTIVEGESDKVIEKINELIIKGKEVNKDLRVGLIACDETKEKYSADVIKSVGSQKDEAKIASELYGILRDFDSEKVDVIFAEGVYSYTKDGQLALAIANRFLKASGHTVIKC